MCGLFTFAVVLSFVSEEVKSQLRGIKQGNYPGIFLCFADCAVLCCTAQLLPVTFSGAFFSKIILLSLQKVHLQLGSSWAECPSCLQSWPELPLLF